MLAVLGGLADAERYLIRTHTADGRSRARPEGNRWTATGMALLYGRIFVTMSS